MDKLDALRRRLEQELPALLEHHRVPAAVLAVAVGEETATAAAGVLNLGTGVAAPPIRYSKSARSPRSGRPPSSCSSSTRAWSTSTPRSAGIFPN